MKLMRPKVGKMPGRVKQQFSNDEHARTKFRDNTQPWRAWYKTKRWERLRIEVFIRDLYRCQRTGVMCTGRHPDANSPVANHKTPHHGDPALFWDVDNIETVTKEVHDGLIQSEERTYQGM